MRRVGEIFERNRCRVDFKLLRRPSYTKWGSSSRSESRISRLRPAVAPRGTAQSPRRERRRLRKNDVGMNPVFRKRIRHLREFLDVLLGDFAAVLAFSDRQSDAVFVETFFRNDHQVRFAGHDFRSGRGDRHRGHVDHTGVQDRIQLLQCQSHRNRALLVILAAE